MRRRQASMAAVARLAGAVARGAAARDADAPELRHHIRGVQLGNRCLSDDDARCCERDEQLGPGMRGPEGGSAPGPHAGPTLLGAVSSQQTRPSALHVMARAYSSAPAAGAFKSGIESRLQQLLLRHAELSQALVGGRATKRC